MTESENYKNFDEYCQKLSLWVKEQRVFMHNYYLSSQIMMHTWMSSNQKTTSFITNNNAQPSAPVNQQTTQDNGNDIDMPIQGQRYSLPHPFRRLVAEMIDYLLLMFVKISVIFIIQGHLSISEIAENIDIDLRYLMNKHRLVINDEARIDGSSNVGQGTNDANSLRQTANPFEIITMEIVYAEILNRIFVTLYEAVCLSGVLFAVSATPGKFVMGIRVVSCKDLFDLPLSRVEVLPGSLPGFCSAFVRSVVKNFAMVFFFPLCMTALIFNHHRTTYDLIAGTIVVRVPPAHQRRLNQAGWAARNPDR